MYTYLCKENLLDKISYSQKEEVYNALKFTIQPSITFISAQAKNVAGNIQDVLAAYVKKTELNDKLSS